MSKVTWFVIILILFDTIGDAFIQNAVETVWMILWGAFFVFLIVYHWMDDKDMFLPKNNNKHKEG